MRNADWCCWVGSDSCQTLSPLQGDVGRHPGGPRQHQHQSPLNRFIQDPIGSCIRDWLRLVLLYRLGRTEGRQRWSSNDPMKTGLERRNLPGRSPQPKAFHSYSHTAHNPSDFTMQQTRTFHGNFSLGICAWNLTTPSELIWVLDAEYERILYYVPNQYSLDIRNHKHRLQSSHGC